MIENAAVRLDVTERGALALTDRRTGARFEEIAGDLRLCDVRSAGDVMLARLSGAAIDVDVRLDLTEDGFTLALHADADAPMPEEIAYPGAWRTREGDLVAFGHSEGVCFEAGEDFPLPERWGMTAGGMAMWVIRRGGSWLICAAEEGADAALVNRREGGLLVSGARWLSEKGRWGYDRAMRFFVAATLGEGCRAYRAWRETLGEIVTLKEKIARAPELKKLIGAADVWLWDDNNMNRLYARPEQSDAPERDVRALSDDMEALGMKRLLWNSFEGETRADCEYLKGKGWLVGKYDIYRDVVPATAVNSVIPYRVKRSRHTKYWPDDVRRDQNGDMARAWQLHTTDGTMVYQNAVCDVCALRMTMEDVPADVADVGYSARLLDVQSGGGLAECYDPRHPATRRVMRRYIRAQHQFLLDLGLACGGEVGSEDYVSQLAFTEGLMSPIWLRGPDAGRRMNTLYYGDEIPPIITDCMLNPRHRLPLWEMVYHDCTVSYWYWGDSSNGCPELMPVRDLFNALYGLPPLYSLNVTQWRQLRTVIAASYRRAAAVAEKVGLLPMTAFEWLTEDRLVQRTVFGGKYAVTANFSNQPYETPLGTIQPLDFLLEELN